MVLEATVGETRDARGVYDDLAEPFEETFRDVRGGVELTYITGEQAIRRLNEVLGVDGWSFKILEHGIHAEADEVWVLAEITALFPGTETPAPLDPAYGFVGTKSPARVVLRQQFGSQKVKRSRASGTPLDIGFDLKGATTDALKKCAMLLGVGLYLSRKEQPEGQHQATATGGQASNGPVTGLHIACEVCGEELKETRFRDGTIWTPEQLAGYGRRKHGRALCMTHYREANDARKREESQGAETPF